MAANRGEWAELYVLFKLLGEGKIYAADCNMNRNINSYLEILKIFREEIRNVITEYRTGTNVEIYVNDALTASIPATKFLRNAETLLDTINSSQGRAFDATDETKEFMEAAKISKIKANNINNADNNIGGKNDIVMQIRDHSNALIYIAGFSIKADGKSPATLFNTAKASAFVYKLIGATEEDMNNINSLLTPDGGKDKNARIQYIKNHDIALEFVGNKILPENDYSVFADNLDMIRGDMQEILNHVILIHYISNEQKKSNLSDICNILTQNNPLNKRNPRAFYEKAIKDFLYAAFSGMTASSRWNGQEQVNGGYIIAKRNGEVLAYHTRDGETFKAYLFKTTKVDRPDASEKKGYPYAHVYKNGDGYYMDLNFQVRFI